MEIDEHLLEYAILNLICNHYELINDTVINEDFFVNANTRKLFNNLKNAGCYDPVKCAMNGISGEYVSKVYRYMAGDEEYTSSWNDRFREYESKLLELYKTRKCSEIVAQLNRGEITYEFFDQQYRSYVSMATESDTCTTYEEFMKDREGVRERVNLGRFPELNKTLKLATTDVVTIGAGPGTGKTSYLLNIMADCMTNVNYNCLYYNLEVDKRKIRDRLICASAHGRISMDQLDETLSETPKEAELTVRKITERKNFKMIEQLIDIDMIFADIMKRTQKDKVNIVFIDHIGLLRSKDQVLGFTALEDIMKKLRVFASTRGVLMFLASQMTRSSTSGESTGNPLYSFASSSEVERSSTHAIVIKEYSDNERMQSNLKPYERKTFLQLDICKNRNGDLGTLDLTFDKLTQNFYEGFKID